MIILLWRLSGKPAASGKTPFKDVEGKISRSSDRYKAILWGNKHGIIRGYESGKYKGQFRTEDPVARKDTLIMLYRLAHKPGVSGSIRFPDVRAMKLNAKSDTYKAILWGTQKGITNGYADGNFQPMTKCMREHIITFMYRFAKNIQGRNVNVHDWVAVTHTNGYNENGYLCDCGLYWGENYDAMEQHIDKSIDDYIESGFKSNVCS